MYICLIQRVLEEMRLVFILFFAGVLVASCSKDVASDEVQFDLELKRLISNASPSGSYKHYILPTENQLSEIPQDFRNELTSEKVSLGKMLFYETGIAGDAKFESGMGTYSCASCHIPEAGFRAGAPQGVADGGKGFGLNGEGRLRQSEYAEADLDVQSARPFSLINVAHVSNTFWNGQFGGGGVNVGTEDLWDLREDTERNDLGFEAIETQNIEGVETHRLVFEEELLDEYGYIEMFDAAFPDVMEDQRYSSFTGSLALSAYIRTINSSQAPFQDWLKGDLESMTDQEKLGASVFFGKARCSNCHYEPNLGSNEFHALGVKDMYQRSSFNASEDDRRNLGRGGFTLKDEDMFKFRVPPIYNMSDSPFYFHGSSKLTLEQVIDYKISATSENPNVDNSVLSDKFKPIDITEEERAALLSFLVNSLRDPNLVRFKPTMVLSGNCIPNNDYDSQVDLGCK